MVESGGTLGGYTLVTAVGVGSTGTVWRAMQGGLGRTVALKVLSPGVSQDLLLSEARVLAMLDHPNIVKVYDVVEAGAQGSDEPAWLAEEWVDGERLDELLTHVDGHRLSTEQALGVIRGALLGFAHAHERGVVHGDVAAGNILVDTEGMSRVIDFGLATTTGDAGSAGTPAFISPEAARGMPVTPASDVYSTAAVLYFLLAGDPPFGSSGAAALVRRHVEEPPPRLRDHGDGLADLLQRALSKDPAERPQDAGAFLAELEAAAAERCGAAWLTRASVAGLAAAPGTAMVIEAMADGGAGPAIAEDVPDVVIATESADADRTLRKRVPRKAVAAGGAVLVAGGVIAAVLASGGSGKKASVSAPAPVIPGPSSVAPAVDPAKASAQAQASAAATAGVAESAQLTGTYTVLGVVTASEIDVEPAGTRFPNGVWTIRKGCLAGPCHFAIDSSSGRKYDALFDGKTLTFVFTESFRQTCEDDVSHQPVPGVTALVTNVLRYRIVVSGLGGSGKLTLEGTTNITQTHSDAVGNCRLDTPATEVRKVTAIQR